MSRPRVLIYTMYFWPEPTSIGPMSSGLAEFLSEAGWDVTVITGFPNLPSWEIYPSYRGKIFQREKHGDVNVRRNWTYVPEKPREKLMKTWKRVLSDCSMPFTGLLPALVSASPDVIVSITPPLQAAAAAILLKAYWRCPLLTWIHDIVPDAALKVGMMKEGTIFKLARKLERLVYDHSDRLAIIVEGFRYNLEAKGVSTNKIVELPIWVDLRNFENMVDRGTARRNLGIDEGAFVLADIGTIGARSSAETIIGAMKILEVRPDIHLVFAGGGNRARAVQDEVARLGMRNVRCFGVLEQHEILSLMCAADLLVVSQKGNLVESLFPSRLLNFAGASKPVLAAVNAQSEAAQFIRRSGCGVITEPEQVLPLVEAVLNLQADPERLTRMGAAGRSYVERTRDQAFVLKRFDNELRTLVGSKLQPELIILDEPNE